MSSARSRATRRSMTKCPTNLARDSLISRRSASSLDFFSLPPNAYASYRISARSCSALCSRTRAANRAPSPTAANARVAARRGAVAGASEKEAPATSKARNGSEGSYETSPTPGREERAECAGPSGRRDSASFGRPLRASPPSRSSAAASAVKSMRRGRVETRVSGRVSEAGDERSAESAESAEAANEGSSPAASAARRASLARSAAAATSTAARRAPPPPPPRRARARALDAGAHQRARFRRIPNENAAVPRARRWPRRGRRRGGRRGKRARARRRRRARARRPATG